ncbi:hypothetical protein AAFF_G00301280 [Aldrovandia affinis]|uniref:Uncharacterized protein n=1 Tax=Aldrovandia affinis TaxID=143900 RepID=A0AAD7SPL7_9TELE|nr:hypothetical protein AAFF_G00301280 [Aldrovandia affinis]
MDDSALQSTQSRKYSITSRLRVTEDQWHNSQNRFQCSVTFYNGKTNDFVSAAIQGDQRCRMTAEENKWSGNAAELSYILVLVKSALFGAFLTTFVFKLKGTGLAQFGN